jgi:peptide/nickel transport system substrate-binding protein
MKQFLFCLCLLLLLSSCSTNKNSDLPEQLRLNLGAEPSILNPLLSTDATSSSITGKIFNGLVRINEDLEIEPDLATTYNISEDGLVYTFTLRDDVTWHDGIPFSGEDVLFTYEKILDPTTNTVRRSGYVYEGKSVVFELIDAYTFRATLPIPFAPFLDKMGMDIIPKHIYEDEDINRSSYNRDPIGTGPYKFKLWKPGQYVILEKNDNYYHGVPKTNTIINKIILDPQAGLISLKKEELDLDGIPPKDVESLRSEEHLDLYSYYDLNYTYLGFNLKHKFLSDNRVRKAIAHAINKDLIVNGVLKGKGLPAHVPTSPLLWSYPEDTTSMVYEYDVEKSKQYLSEAGFLLNEKTNIYEKDGAPLSFTILTNQGNKERAKSAQLIQNFLKEIGIHVDIQILEWSSFVKLVSSDQDPKAYDAVILGWSLSLDPDSYSIWHSSEYPKGFNFVGYENDRVDDLLIKGRRETVQEKRKEIYRALYQEITNDLPYVFLYYPESTVGVHKRVKGLSKPGPGGLMNQIQEISVSK